MADQRISMAKDGNEFFFSPHRSQWENLTLDVYSIGMNGNETLKFGHSTHQARRIFIGCSSLKEMRGRAAEQSLFLDQRCSLVCHCIFLTRRHLPSMKNFNKLFC